MTSVENDSTNDYRGKACVLVVDDDPHVVRTLSRLLGMYFTVLKASDPAEALSLVKNNLVHVVISDQRMPKITGVELLKKVALLSPFTSRILLTGYSDLEAVMSSINESEICRYITKPWSNKALVSDVAAAAELSIKLKEEDSISNGVFEKAKATAYIDEFSESLSEPSGSLDELSRSLREPFGSLDESSGSLDELSRSLREPFGSLDEPSGSLSEPSGSLSEPSGSLSEPSGSLSEPSGSLGESSGSLGEPSGSLGEPSRPLSEVSGPLGDLSEALNDLPESFDELTKFFDETFTDVNEASDPVDKNPTHFDEAFDSADKAFDSVDKNPIHFDKTFDSANENPVHFDKTFDPVDKSSMRFDKAFDHIDKSSMHFDKAFDPVDKNPIHFDETFDPIDKPPARVNKVSSLVKKGAKRASKGKGKGKSSQEKIIIWQEDISVDCVEDIQEYILRSTRLSHQPITFDDRKKMEGYLNDGDNSCTVMVACLSKFHDDKTYEFLERLKIEFPYLVTIVLTPEAYLEQAVAIINNCRAYRYLSSPTSFSQFKISFGSALEHQKRVATSYVLRSFNSVGLTESKYSLPYFGILGKWLSATFAR